jgi:hypothetical protein
MKSFKQKLSEVSKHNRSDENNRFKDIHDAETVKHPVAPDDQFTGEIKGKTKKKRPADDGTDANYDSAYIKKTGSDAGGGRKLGEEAEQIDEISRSMTPMRNRFGPSVDSKKWNIYKKHMQKHSLDGDTVRMAHDDPNAGESKRMLKNPKYAKALALYKKHMKEDVDLAENPMEEKPMMMNALRSMSHAMQGIAAYVSKTSDPEEWFQNKLAGVAKEMQTLYSYATAEVMSMGEELEETTQAATKKPVTMTGPDGKTRTVMRTTRVKQTDDDGMDKMSETKKVKANELIKRALGGGVTESKSAALAKELDKATASTKAGKKAVTLKKAPWEKNESVNLDEAVRPGNFKFDNGKSTKVSSQDAKLLNSMFKGLNTKNRKQMESVMKKDQAGYDEIVGFAREAL